MTPRQEADEAVLEFAALIAARDQETTGRRKPPTVTVTETAMDPQPFDLELDPNALSESSAGRGGSPTPPPPTCPPANPCTVSFTWSVPGCGTISSLSDETQSDKDLATQIQYPGGATTVFGFWCTGWNIFSDPACQCEVDFGEVYHPGGTGTPYIGITFWLVKVIDADCWGEGENGQWLLYPTVFNSGSCLWRGDFIVLGASDDIFLVPLILDFTVPIFLGGPAADSTVHIEFNPC